MSLYASQIRADTAETLYMNLQTKEIEYNDEADVILLDTEWYVLQRRIRDVILIKTIHYVVQDMYGCLVFRCLHNNTLGLPCALNTILCNTTM